MKMITDFCKIWYCSKPRSVLDSILSFFYFNIMAVAVGTKVLSHAGLDREERAKMKLLLPVIA